MTKSLPDDPGEINRQMQIETCMCCLKQADPFVMGEQIKLPSMQHSNRCSVHKGSNKASRKAHACELWQAKSPCNMLRTAPIERPIQIKEIQVLASPALLRHSACMPADNKPSSGGEPEPLAMHAQKNCAA